MGMGGKDMVTMSKAELALRSDNDAALMNWKAKKGKGGKVDRCMMLYQNTYIILITIAYHRACTTCKLWNINSVTS